MTHLHESFDPAVIAWERDALLEVLTKAAPFVGWVANREPMIAGVNSDELCDEIDALLAKIGGDA